MTRRKNEPGGRGAPPLLHLAVSYAEHAMSATGRVPPTLIAETEDGILLYLPEKMGNERAKDNFANTARLVAVGYRATSVAMILESWACFAKPGKPLNTTTPPSQSPDREEVVVISVETGDQKLSKILVIQRDSRGKFTGFDNPDIPRPDDFQGRFAGIMPPKPPDESGAKMARQLLAAIGVAPANQGFNPGWN